MGRRRQVRRQHRPAARKWKSVRLYGKNDIVLYSIADWRIAVDSRAFLGTIRSWAPQARRSLQLIREVIEQAAVGNEGYIGCSDRDADANIIVGHRAGNLAGSVIHKNADRYLGNALVFQELGDQIGDGGVRSLRQDRSSPALTSRILNQML